MIRRRGVQSRAARVCAQTGWRKPDRTRGKRSADFSLADRFRRCYDCRSEGNDETIFFDICSVRLTKKPTLQSTHGSSIPKTGVFIHRKGNGIVSVTEGNKQIYLDLNTLYRNLVKEMVCATHKDKLYVMVKGGDWAFSTQPVDWALGVLGYTSVQVPMRIFTPQIVTETGAKLSKSLIRDGDTSLEEVPEWILDMGKFEKHNPDYVDYIVWLVELFLSHPRHMYRSYSYQEIIRIFKQKK
jgi:hypothetical protein